MEVPDYATHYYLPMRRPFQNLSDLSDDELGPVLAELQQLSRDGAQVRRFGRPYIEWRRLTEAKLRKGFLAAGGKIERPAPHYFVLGESRWYESLAPDMRSIRTPLTELPTEVTSWTVTDSFDAMGCGASWGFPPREGRDERVYRLEELAERLKDHEIVEPDGHDLGPGAHLPFVEIQVWSDSPIRQHL